MHPYFPKPKSLADAVDKVARQSAGKDWGLYASLLQHWTEIIGVEYARVTTPVKITFPYQPNEAQRKNGTLTVRLPKGLAMEFSFKAEILRARVNAFFGYEAFARIALAPASLPLPETRVASPPDPALIARIEQTASIIENNELRDVLANFGKTLAARAAQ